MDPLSMAASIIAVLQLTTTLTSYISDARNATKEQTQIAVEASSLFGLLTSLRYRVEAATVDDPWFREVRNLGIGGGPLDQLGGILEEMVKRVTTTSKKDQIRSALVWPFTRPEIERALNRIERLKTYIITCLANDEFALSQSIHAEILASRQQWQSHADEELLKRMSEWLGAPDPSSNYHAALEKRHPHTGLWLVNGKHFQNWREGPSALMWLHGNAGCGKTILSAAALQTVLQEPEHGERCVVAYFYFDFNDTEKQSSIKAIRSLLLQFARQDNDSARMLEQLYRRCSSGQQQPSRYVVRALLQDMLAIPKQKYLLLDALDECKDSELLPLITEIVQGEHPSLRILATSRRERDIEDCLAEIAGYDINIQSVVIDEDIRMYIEDRLAVDPRLRKWPPLEQQKILTALIEKADGMFRWVFCQLESLRKCVKPRDLQKALNSLPKTLDDTYERILKSLESDDYIDDAIKVLRWLCYSERPMRLLELREALAIETGPHGGFFIDNRLPDPADLKLVCSSLITVGESGALTASNDFSFLQSVRNQGSIEVRLAHFSVKEYLLSDRCVSGQEFGHQLSHKLLTEACLHYLLHLNEQGPLSPPVISEYACAQYAAEYWWKHAHLAGELSGPSLDLAAQLFQSKSTMLPWLQLYDPDKIAWPEGPTLSFILEIDDTATPLYYAASIGLHDLVGHLLRESPDVNARGGLFGNALQAASRGGYEDVVRRLVDNGAEVNAKGGYYGNALQAAAAEGREAVVRVLLDRGADIETHGRGQRRNPLQAAAWGGHGQIVQLLLDRGADVNAWAGHYGTALQAASRRGHVDIVRILLGSGASVNARGGDYGTALQAASLNGHGEIVRMLFDGGGTLGASGRFGPMIQASQK